MPDLSPRPSWKKRFLVIAGGSLACLLLFVVAVRITVRELFDGIASSRTPGLSGVAGWDMRSFWSSGWSLPMLQKGAATEQWIARSADLSTRTASFDHSATALHQIVAKHHGYFEDLRTESHSGYGRTLVAVLAVPSEEFDATLSELRILGRVESSSQAGEDSAVQLAAAARRLTASQINLSRLQKLQRERQGELRDAVALEKDIAQANEAVAEAERQHESLLSTVALAHIRVTLLEDYRAPLQLSLSGALLQVRNSLVVGIGAIFSTIAFVLSVLLGYGLPLLFWLALLFLPLRAVWRRFHHAPTAVASI
ncbi:MAG TPA: DUF4349 domain-containing protein [Candidatus Sulfotelmatobacter sp.]|nr:DUF4349 domain-containing protein [Candidatus Sulfotelmatobacter sp.]